MRKIVIQAKRYDDTVGNKAVQEAHAAQGYYHASDAWVVTTATAFSKDAMDLANRLAVHLVPGPQLFTLPQQLLSQMQPPPSQTPLLPSPTFPLLQTPSITRPEDPSPMGPNMERNSALTSPKPVRVSKRSLILVAVALSLIGVVATIYGTRGHDAQPEVASAPVREGASSNEKAIRALIDTWVSAVQSRDVVRLEECYAPMIDFYRLRNVPRNRGTRELARAFDRYNSIAIHITNLSLRDVTDISATADFDKEWDFRGATNYAGSGRQELRFSKDGGQWRISSETELGKPYWVRHPK